MMVATPAVTPVTKPVAEPMVAMVVGVELHTPPVVASVNVVVAPTQMFVRPVGVAGPGLTVSVLVARQPVGKE